MSWLPARFQRAVACGLVGLVLTSAAGWLHVAEVSDVVPVSHDASAHRIEAADGPAVPADQHCYLCHWERTLRVTPGRGARLGADPASARAHLDPSVPVHPGAHNLRIPARAPPA